MSLNIIAIMQHYPPGVGGIQSIAQMLYTKMCDSFNINVTVLLNVENCKTCSSYYDGKIKIIPTKFPKAYYKKFGLRYFKFLYPFYRFKKVIKEQINPDAKNIIHIHWPEDFFYAHVLRKQLQIPVVWTCHGGIAVKRVNQIYTNKEYFKNLLNNNSLIDKIIFVSTSIKEQLQIDALKSISDVIPNGVNTSIYNIKSNSSDVSNKILILYAGRLIPLKKIDFIIKSLAEIKDIDYEFHIAGDGELESELKQLCIKLNIENKIKFLSSLSNMQEVYPIYNIYVSASKVEGLPISPIEAMSCGLLPLLSDIPQHKELLQGLGGNYLFDNNSEQSFIDTFKNIVDQLNSNASEIVSNFAKQKYDISIVAKKYINRVQ